MDVHWQNPSLCVSDTGNLCATQAVIEQVIKFQFVSFFLAGINLHIDHEYIHLGHFPTHRIVQIYM